MYPNSQSIVVLDNTACINYNLNFQPPQTITTKIIMAKSHLTLVEFLNFKDILGFTACRFQGNPDLFKTNVHNAVIQLFKENGLDNVLTYFPAYAKDVKEKLNRRIAEFDKKIAVYPLTLTTPSETETIKKVFKDNQKKLRSGKDPIPEPEDIHIIHSTKNSQGFSTKFIISMDGHFTEYAQEIDNNFQIFIIKEYMLNKYNNEIKQHILKI